MAGISVPELNLGDGLSMLGGRGAEGGLGIARLSAMRWRNLVSCAIAQPAAWPTKLVNAFLDGDDNSLGSN